MLFDLASLYYKQRHFRNMRRVFERYAALLPSASPPTRELCSMMGLSCTAMGDIAEGVKWYKRALERDPAFRDTWLNLFQAYKEGGLVRRLRVPACVCLFAWASGRPVHACVA